MPDQDPEDDVRRDDDPSPSDDPEPKSDDRWDEARARSTIEKLRKENRELAKLRHEHREANEKLAALETEQLSETEKLRKQNEDLARRIAAAEEAARAERLSRTVAAEARKLGFVNEDEALALLNQDQLEFEDDEPKNLPVLLKKILDDRPHLKVPDPGGRTIPPTPDGRGGSMTAQQRLAQEIESRRSSGRYSSL